MENVFDQGVPISIEALIRPFQEKENWLWEKYFRQGVTNESGRWAWGFLGNPYSTIIGDSTSRPYGFRFWESSFDGLRILYDHFNAEGDVEKVKSVGTQKLIQHIGTHPMKITMLCRALFKVYDSFEKNDIESKKRLK